MFPIGEEYSMDWILSTASNAHVCKSRSWFTSYTAISSHIVPVIGGSSATVLGIGSVSLPLKSPTKKSGSQTITLPKVLHCPTVICNIISVHSFLEDYDLDGGIFGPNGGFIRDKKTRRKLGIVESIHLPKLRLKGQPAGSTSLKMDGGFSVSVRWPQDEVEKWGMADHRTADTSQGVSEEVLGGVASYSAVEQAWIKKHYGNEYKFLLSYGLKIHSEEDRAEGRRILGAMMMNDEEEGSDQDNESTEGSDANNFLEDLEADPMSHVADYLFSWKELDWIKKHYRHSGNFLLSYGLKPFDDEDCGKGKAILKQMMES